MVNHFIAFLRGINVGGNKKVPMADLKIMFETMGYTNIRTLLNSGNVLFDADETSASLLAEAIEAQMEQTFGFGAHTIIRTLDEMQALVQSNPFKGIRVTPAMRLYITFLTDKPTGKLKIPYESPDKLFKILAVTDSHICSVLTVTDTKNTTDAMGILEKEYGKNVTTRNWNTVEKMLI